MPRRRRRDGIYFREWDQSWYSSVTGKQKPLRDENGNKIKGRHSEQAAKRAYARLLLTAGISEQARGVPTISDINIDYLRSRKPHCTPNYIRLASMILARFDTDMGHTPPQLLTPAQVEQWLPQTGWNQNTQHTAVRIIKAAFNHACRITQRLDKNPITAVRSPTTAPRTEIFSEEQLAAFFAAASPALREICQFMNETGCRPGEAIRLKARHFRDGPEHAEFVLPPEEHKTGRRTGKSRHILLSKAMTEYCRTLVAKRPTGTIFRTNKGRAWSAANLQTQFRRAATLAGIPRTLTPHSFRHTFATRHIDRGISIAKVATWLGDTVATVERTYWRALHAANKHRFDGLD